jgi:hypothetical protein
MCGKIGKGIRARFPSRVNNVPKLLADIGMDAWLAWAPLMRAARAEAESDLAGFSVAIQRTGCGAAQARISELENDMQPLAEEIGAAPATSLGGLRAKALVALWEALPASAFHHGAFQFRDDGEASGLRLGRTERCCA